MKWITKGNPDKDGTYIVTKGYGKNIYTDFMTFTTDGGWNTYRDEEGNANKSEAFDGTVVGEDDYLRAWAPMPKVYGGEDEDVVYE